MLCAQTDISCNEPEAALLSWHESFSPGLRITDVNEASTTNSWHLTFTARGYVCQYVGRSGAAAKCANEGFCRLARQKLHVTLLELDATIDRIMNQNAGQFNTWLFHTCISTAIALHIERYLDPFTISFESVLAALRVQPELQFLREMAKSWPYIISFANIFGVVNYAGLPIPFPGPGLEPSGSLHSPTLIDRLNLPGKVVMPYSNFWLANTDSAMTADIPSGPFDANSILDEIMSENFQWRNK
ncbi:hypothetical protein BDV12DRAFT_199056 [Aspergillus spectabilis]